MLPWRGTAPRRLPGRLSRQACAQPACFGGSATLLVRLEAGDRFGFQCLRQTSALETIMAQAHLIVRTKLAKLADRQAFDDWYRLERLRDAVKGFRAQRGWRSWSRTNPLVHFAVYEFSTTEEAEAALDSPAFDALVAEFDRVWGARAERTREIFETAGEFTPSNAE
jgi:hypothetical protein